MYKIFTKKLAKKLCDEGFRVIGTEINNNKPWLWVYLFEDSEELRAAVDRLKRE